MSFSQKINIQLIIRIVGMLLMMEALFMWLGLIVSFSYDCNPLPLLFSGSITFIIGAFLRYFTQNENSKQIGKREGYLIVSITYIAITLFGTLPYYIGGSIPSFTDAFFESMSGITATGSTILDEIEAIPKDILFWRSITQWIGGMGFIVLTLAILPMLGIGGMQLYQAEMPGPTKDKQHPRITETAKKLWGIYVAFTAAQVGLLMLGGVDLYESVCHAFTTMASGGFSTRTESIAGFSPYVQYVIMVFMVLSGVNFTLHYMAMLGKFKGVWRNDELRYYLSLLLLVSLVVSIVLAFQQNSTIESAFRRGFFQVISITTTTGYATCDYMLWPSYLSFVIFLLFFSGACAGSTSGGIKIIRQLLLFRNSRLELRRQTHPQAIIPVKLNGKTVHRDVIFKVLAFYLFYMLIFAFGSAFMTTFGLDFDTAIGSVAATLGNVGPGIGSVGPAASFSFIPDLGKWFLSFLMLLGRLELFTILILLSPHFWKQ